MQRELFDLVLEHVGHPDEDVAAAATESVVVLMGELLRTTATWPHTEPEPKAVVGRVGGSSMHSHRSVWSRA